MMCVLIRIASLRYSNQQIVYTIFNIKKKITINYLIFAVMGIFFNGLKNEFKTAVSVRATESLLYTV